ncbi:MAG: oligoendopeptidase F [Flavobacteriales bacterium]|nr:MAG: oligoendopeptidase F [Flavobacteriales bacterium]
MAQTVKIEIPTRPPRKFLNDTLKITAWEVLEPFFEDLKKRKINAVEELEKWLKDRSELEAVLEEDLAWRYIKMSIDTADESLTKSYEFFVQEINPKVAPYSNELDKKLLDCPLLNELNEEKYRIYLRSVKKRIEIFREENIPLLTQLQTESQKYMAITGKMSIEQDGKELTMQQAGKLLESTDRKLRETVFTKMAERRAQDVDELNELFNHLIKLRHKVAQNAGFENYRDYMFAAMGRFDYSVQDCRNFHESIAREIVPIVRDFHLERKEKLGLDALRPWDMDVDITGKPPLKPFEKSEELVTKTALCFREIRPFFADCIETMNTMGHLDLESRKGKAPGGYNYPLHEIGVPFIFMNAVGSLSDVTTMVHEGGHAIHSFLTRKLELTDFKSTPSEVAELASMSMELISMENWEVFFENENELKRAKQEQMQRGIQILPWIATVDKFQHWIYENPEHSVEERTAKWVEILDEFGTGVSDWSGFEEARSNSWQKQLHIFEVPFYYIEYGMAQLGAVAMWRNYKQHPQQALDGYEAFMKLGYTKSIPEIYGAAGIKFDFSGEYVKELAGFVRDELAKI